MWEVEECLFVVHDPGLSDAIVVDKARVSTMNFSSGVCHDTPKLNVGDESILLSAREPSFPGLILYRLLSLVLGTRWWRRLPCIIRLGGPSSTWSNFESR